MYTSGWPKIQKICCQSTGFPPLSTLKKLAPKIRSKVSSTRPTVIAGNANNMMAEVINVVHENIGIRIKDMPGARIVMIVARKFRPPINVPKPAICSPIV